MTIAFIIAHKRNNVVVLFGTLKVQSFILTEVSDCGLLIVVTFSGTGRGGFSMAGGREDQGARKGNGVRGHRLPSPPCFV